MKVLYTVQCSSVLFKTNMHLKFTCIIQAYHFRKNDFELGVAGEGQDTSQHFEGSFGSIRAILSM